MKVYQSLSENMLTVNMLLSVFFLPGVFVQRCPRDQAALFITAPKEIEALNGSCLEIPCSFQTTEHINSNTNINGVWMKNHFKFGTYPNVVIFNTSGSVNIYHLKITGDLREKNCNTLFPDLKTNYTDKYFFRIENGPVRATACANPLQIIITDSPWSPSINVPSDLKEHQSVTVTCSAFTPCPHSPPELTWNLQQDSLRHTEKNTNGTFTSKIQEKITLSDTHDGYNISCSARYPVIGGIKTAETEVTLSVSYAPRNTSASISPSGLVSAGSWVELSCSSRAKPPPRFTWFWISEHGAMNVSVGPVYSFNVTEGGKYYCVATNDLGQHNSSEVHVEFKDSKERSFYLVVIVVGVILIICLVLCAWFFKSKRPASPQTQNKLYEEVAVQSNEPEEEIHYGKIKFLQRRREASCVSVQDRAQQQTEYAQVNMSADRAEDLYAQVKKT